MSAVIPRWFRDAKSTNVTRKNFPPMATRISMAPMLRLRSSLERPRQLDAEAFRARDALSTTRGDQDRA